MRNVAEFRKSKFVLAVHRFSSPPRIDDLAALALDEEDLDDIKRCRPGECGLKLSAAEIEQLQRAIPAAGESWKPAVQFAFRDLMLSRIEEYHSNGLATLEEYHDHQNPKSPALSFSRILQRSTFLQEPASSISGVLTGLRWRHRRIPKNSYTGRRSGSAAKRLSRRRSQDLPAQEHRGRGTADDRNADFCDSLP